MSGCPPQMRDPPFKNPAVPTMPKVFDWAASFPTVIGRGPPSSSLDTQQRTVSDASATPPVSYRRDHSGNADDMRGLPKGMAPLLDPIPPSAAHLPSASLDTSRDRPPDTLPSSEMPTGLSSIRHVTGNCPRFAFEPMHREPPPATSVVLPGDADLGTPRRDLPLNQHKSNKPSKPPKTHHCDKCGKDFPRPCVLRDHMAQHENLDYRPYPCTFPGCRRSFSTSSNAKRHERKHGIKTPTKHSPKSESNTLTFEQPIVLEHQAGQTYSTQPTSLYWINTNVA